MMSSDVAWESLARHYFFSKDFSLAEYCFKLLTRKTPNGKRWYFRGLCFKFQQLYESALYCLDQALKYEYNEALVLYHMGAIHGELDNYDHAIYYLTQAEYSGISVKRTLAKKLQIYLKYNKIHSFDLEISNLTSATLIDNAIEA